MIIDIILGLFIFHFNCSQILASLLVYAILSVLLFPVVLWVVSMFRPEYFESGLFSAASGFIHMTKSFFFPIVGGLLAMIISEKVSPTRVEVKIAITDFEPEPVANVTAQYEADYIMPAVRNLGDFGEVISLKLEKIGRPYDNILDALKNDRVDLAVVSPFTYIFYQKLGDHTFSNSLKVVGFKFPNTGGHQYFSGFVFNRACGDTIRQMLRGVDGLVDTNIKDKRMRLILSDEPLSTSGRIIPARWLLERGLDTLVSSADYLPSKEMLPLLGSDARYFGSLSSNQWDILQKTDPKLAEKLEFYPLEEVPIPFDPLMVNRKAWDDKFNRWRDLVTDFFLLRNVDLSKTRQDIILEALRGIVRPAGEGEWDSRNRDFINYLFTGIVKDKNGKNYSVIFPEPYNLLGYSLGYQPKTGSMIDGSVTHLAEPSVSVRKDDWYSFNYPYTLSPDLSHLLLKVDSVSKFAEGFQEIHMKSNTYPWSYPLGVSPSWGPRKISPLLHPRTLLRIFNQSFIQLIDRKNLPGRRFSPLPGTCWPNQQDCKCVSPKPPESSKIPQKRG